MKKIKANTLSSEAWLTANYDSAAKLRPTCESNLSRIGRAADLQAESSRSYDHPFNPVFGIAIINQVFCTYVT